MSFIKMRNGYTPEKRKLHYRSIVTDLIIHDSIKVTKADAKALKAKADKMVTLAKKGTLAARRQAAAYINRVQITDKQNSLQKLFDVIGPKFKDRKGGYTRVLKLDNRRGDDALMCLVTWSE